MRFPSVVPVSRNGYKTVSNLVENLYIYKILYKIVSNWTDHIQQIHNQSENDDILGEPKKLRFASIIIWI